MLRKLLAAVILLSWIAYLAVDDGFQRGVYSARGWPDLVFGRAAMDWWREKVSDMVADGLDSRVAWITLCLTSVLCLLILLRSGRSDTLSDAAPKERRS